MNLVLKDDDPLNDVFMQSDGRPLYLIDSPFKFFGGRKSTLSRVANGNVPIGSIERHSFSSPEVSLSGRRISFERSGMFSVSETFQASDGKLYKWKISGGHPLLVRTGHSNAPIVTYSPRSGIFSSKNRPAMLNIAPEGMPILDDIVLTFAYMENKRRERKRRARNNAAAGASSAGAASGGGGGGGC